MRSDRPPHPVASAFFDAFDAARDGTPAPSNQGEGGGVSLGRIRNSLGWRTRHAASAAYPVSLRPAETRIGARHADGGEARASFRVRQAFPRDDDEAALGTGAAVWPGAIVLLKYLEKAAHDPRRNDVLGGKTVVDLGCGTAVTSIAAALLGARVVVCTDGCNPVLSLACRNIQDAVDTLDSGGRSRPAAVHGGDAHSRGAPMPRHWDFRGSDVYAQAYRWGEGVQHLRHGRGKAQHFDVILAADCIVPQLYPLQSLVDALDELSGADTVSYLSYEQRHFEEYDPAVEFRRLAGEHNLEVEVVADDELDPIYPASDIQVWKVTRKRLRHGTKDAGKKGIPLSSIWGRGGSNHQSLLVGRRPS